jgi:glutathione synthase/RimK-type ligase-like ATP-grasp enzyme
MKRLALVTAVAATGHDDDLAPLLEACTQAGLETRVVAWDDATVSWRRFDAALLRSPWDYTERLMEFLGWCDRVQQSTRLLNSPTVVRWNTDKHYLASLEAAGVPVVSTVFVEPEAEPLEALQAFLASEDVEEFVVKPAVSAGARDTQRYSRAQDFAAGNHIARLLEQGRSVMLQPYLRSVDSAGEAALVYFDGQFSHSINKAALLRPDHPATATPHATGGITPREAEPAERRLAESVLSAVEHLLQLDQPLPYSRIDIIRDDAGNPRLLELELTEPSLFFAQASGSVERFAANLARHLNA